MAFAQVRSYPLLDPSVSPAMKWRWSSRKTTSVGRATMTEPAARRL